MGSGPMSNCSMPAHSPACSAIWCWFRRSHRLQSWTTIATVIAGISSLGVLLDPLLEQQNGDLIGPILPHSGHNLATSPNCERVSDMISDSNRSLGSRPGVARQGTSIGQVSRIEVGALEEWNSRFGADSLFDAWTSNHLLHGLYAANAACLRQFLSSDWTALEVGGGDGRLWSHLSDIQPGNLWVVDLQPWRS